MTLSPALSTPLPLSHKRNTGEKRKQRTPAGASTTHGKFDDVGTSGLTPAKTIQTDDAPLTRREIQMDERQSDTRLAHIATLERLRLDLRALIEGVAHWADIEQLELSRIEIPSYSRHRAVQQARTWASAAGVTIETGLMQLEHALRPTSTEDQS